MVDYNRSLVLVIPAASPPVIFRGMAGDFSIYVLRIDNIKGLASLRIQGLSDLGVEFHHDVLTLGAGSPLCLYPHVILI